MESVRGGGAGERAGRPCRAVARCATAGVPAAHLPHASIASMSRAWSISSGCGTHASAIPCTAARTVAGAACRRKAFGEIGRSRVNLRAQCAASGACASACRLCSSSQPAGWPSRPASTRSHASTDTAIVCCRPAAATGSARRAHTSAIRASICRSSPVSPITDGISPASRARPASEM
jgi:hypothetical protein